MQTPSTLTIAVSTDLDAIKTHWLILQSQGLTTLYQTYEWCSAWLETAGKKHNIEPFFVTGHDENGNCAFILPVHIRQKHGLRIVEWLTYPHLTYGFGLYSYEFLTQNPNALSDLWPEIIVKLPSFDLINLAQLPDQLENETHPLKKLFSFKAANSSYRMHLSSNYQELYASKRSSSTRRGDRKRDKRLESAADIRFSLKPANVDIHTFLDTMFIQQNARLAESGIHNAYGNSAQAFIHRLADTRFDDQTPVLLPYHLTMDGKMVATMLGGNFAGTYWAMISTLGDIKWRTLSPGNYALRKTIAACCSAQMSVFDFADGHSNYKSHWADDAIPLHHICYGLTTKGKIAAKALQGGISLKRKIKASPILWTIFTNLRRILRGSRNRD